MWAEGLILVSAVLASGTSMPECLSLYAGVPDRVYRYTITYAQGKTTEDYSVLLNVGGAWQIRTSTVEIGVLCTDRGIIPMGVASRGEKKAPISLSGVLFPLQPIIGAKWSYTTRISESVSVMTCQITQVALTDKVGKVQYQNVVRTACEESIVRGGRTTLIKHSAIYAEGHGEVFRQMRQGDAVVTKVAQPPEEASSQRSSPLPSGSPQRARFITATSSFADILTGNQIKWEFVQVGAVKAPYPAQMKRVQRSATEVVLTYRGKTYVGAIHYSYLDIQASVAERTLESATVDAVRKQIIESRGYQADSEIRLEQIGGRRVYTQRMYRPPSGADSFHYNATYAVVSLGNANGAYGFLVVVVEEIGYARNIMDNGLKAILLKL